MQGVAVGRIDPRPIQVQASAPFFFVLGGQGSRSEQDHEKQELLHAASFVLIDAAMRFTSASLNRTWSASVTTKVRSPTCTER